MHRIFFALILLLLLPGCLKDSDPPEPGPITSNFFIYNFLTEDHNVHWEIKNEIVESALPYGATLLGTVFMEDMEEDIPVVVKKSGSETILQSKNYLMEQFHLYNLSIVGTEQDPRLLFEPMDLNAPSTGMIKFRLLLSTREIGAVDVYIGGSAPEHKKISGIYYTDFSEYVESSEEELWESIIITPIDVSPADSTSLSYTGNSTFFPDQVYLGVLGHVSDSPTAPVVLIIYEQPKGSL
jgi:hypothetical protein